MSPGFPDDFAGEVVHPDDEGYDAARAVWNGMVDRRPALVVRPTSADDIALAVRYGREQGLPIAVRGGGHSIPGLSTCDDGIVIDLSRMRGVDRRSQLPDRACRTAAPCSPNSTTRRRRTGSSAPSASSPTPGSRGSRSAAAWAGSSASSA